jgi:hypothetical protein
MIYNAFSLKPVAHRKGVAECVEVEEALTVSGSHARHTIKSVSHLQVVDELGFALQLGCGQHRQCVASLRGL